MTQSSKTAIVPLVIIAPILFLSLVLTGCSARTVDSALVADAGKGTSTFVGRPVQLDGSGSKDQRGGGFSYLWTIIKRPSGSKAALSNDKTSKPVLTPDQAGKFVVQLKITDGSFESTAVTTTVDADYPPAAFLSLTTWTQLASNGKASDYGIQLGLMSPDNQPPVTYPAPDFPSQYSSYAPIGFQMLVLNRSDGTILDGFPKSYPMVSFPNDANVLQADLQNLGTAKDKLVIISSLQSAANDTLSKYSGLVTALENIGASSNIGNLTTGQSYSMVGVNGTSSGSAYEFYGSQHGNASPVISGKLIRDPTQHFRFTYDYLPFETRTTDTSNPQIPVNSITIGGTTYPLPSTALADASNGGFHVLVLKRDSLEKVSQNFYQLNKGGAAQSSVMSQMGSDLYSIALRNDYLVIISSTGTLPNIRGIFTNSFKNYSNTARNAEWAFDMLGGTPGVFNVLGSGSTYALVGAGPGTTYNTKNNPKYDYTMSYTRQPDSNYPIVSVEASSAKNGSMADLRGLLTKDRLGWYSAVLSDGGGGKTAIDYSLIPLALQNPSDWRGPDNDKEKQIYQDLSMVLLQGLPDVDQPGDVRQYYYRTDFSWSDRRTDLAFLTCDKLKTWAPDTTLDCTDSDTLDAFNTMQMYLMQEIEMRDDLQAWFYTDLMQLLDGIENSQIVSLATDYQNAIAATSVDPKTPIFMDILNVLGDVLASASDIIDIVAVAPPVATLADEPSTADKVGGGMGVASSLIALGTEIYDLASPKKQDTLPGQVKDAAANLWKDIVSQYINSQANLDQAFLLITSDWGRMSTFHGYYSGLYDKTQMLNVLQAMEPGINVSFYKTLLPVIYHVEPIPYAICSGYEQESNNNPCYFNVCNSSTHQENYEKCPTKSNAPYRPDDSLITIVNLWYWDQCSTSDFSSSFYTVWKSNSTSTSDYYSDETIKLFQPVSAGGLGVNMNEFATRWPFSYEYPDHWSDACNCSPATRPCPEQ